tara:strand:+ start:7844 stop:8137 length:294 start_codon:yes stop_codon:yes gene_type:complete
MNDRKNIDLEQIVKRSSDIISSEVDGEVVMMSVDQGMYFGMDSIGGEIWKKLEEPKSISALCKELSQEYNESYTTIEEDVVKFMHDLLQNNIVEKVD